MLPPTAFAMILLNPTLCSRYGARRSYGYQRIMSREDPVLYSSLLVDPLAKLIDKSSQGSARFTLSRLFEKGRPHPQVLSGWLWSYACSPVLAGFPDLQEFSYPQPPWPPTSRSRCNFGCILISIRTSSSTLLPRLDSLRPAWPAVPHAL